MVTFAGPGAGPSDTRSEQNPLAMSTAWPADPFRILLVVDNDEIARGVAASLGPDFAGGLRTCMKPDQVKAQTRSHRAQAIIIALESLDDAEQIAQILQNDAGARPFLLALCDGAGTAHRRPPQQGRHRRRLLSTSRHWLIRIASPPASASPRGSPPPASAMADLPKSRAAPRQPAPQPRSADRSSSSSRTTKVLHTLVAAMLESEPVDLVFETDGAAAFDRVSALGPDLVLMDVMLPGGDGVALTERIKSTPDLAAIPVVMLSGEARLETLVRSMEAGAADFIVEPFTRKALIAKLASTCRSVSNAARRLGVGRGARTSGRGDADAAELAGSACAGGPRIALPDRSGAAARPRAPRERDVGELHVAEAAHRQRQRRDLASPAFSRSGVERAAAARRRGARSRAISARSRRRSSVRPNRSKARAAQAPCPAPAASSPASSSRPRRTLRGGWPSLRRAEQPAAPCRTRAARRPRTARASARANSPSV